MKNKLFFILLVLSVAGLTDASYLTYEHYSGFIPPCNPNAFIVADCGKVLRSDYSVVFGIPLALFGVAQYILIFCWTILAKIERKSIYSKLGVLQSLFGFLFSMYFVYLQLVVIKAICWYCMGSALISTVIFFVSNKYYERERKELLIFIFSVLYRYIVKKILFKIDPEKIHVLMVRFGELINRISVAKDIVSHLILVEIPVLSQNVGRIKFRYPVGLAAGFDYEARLTQALAPWGFGFQTVGTITNKSYGGNPAPMLGRLPKSKSLLVNKGFKNPGASEIVNKLSQLSFEVPVGISIGRTNSRELSTQKESVVDVVEAFMKFEKSKVKHAYYELNISCPNLFGDIEFYSTKNLTDLLKAVEKLKLSRPVFVKMPIDKSEKETKQMLDVISKFSPVGVIFGNLQKNRLHQSLDKDEVDKWKKGNFSGKPTYEDSNKLIRLTYKHYKNRFIIIGCGGIFSAEDAYTKIRLGATLLQMITGMIYEGPQVIMEINLGLERLLKEDGFNSLAEARGVDVN